MARKKKTDSGAKKVDASHVKGLRAEVLEQPITHQEVQETANRVAPLFKKLVTESIKKF